MSVAEILLDSGSKNVELTTLLLELLTIRIDKMERKQIDKPKSSRCHLNINPKLLGLYAKLTIHLLQSYMEKVVEKSETKLTNRSYKNIYKVQAYYYY